MHRIGLIGSGGIAEAHAAAYAEIENAEIVAVASKENAGEFIDEHAPGAGEYDDVDDLLDEVDPDVVDACVPTYVHKDVVEKAVTRGYDTLCEKPVARTLDQAREMADVVADSDVTFMVGHTVRFSPPYRRIKELVADEIGDPAVIRASRVGPYPDWCWNNWFADTEKSGGILLDLVVHDFDYLRWVFGEVDRVFTRNVQWRDGEALMDHAVTLLRFESGAVAHVEGSWAQQETRPFTYSIEVAGDDGLVEYDGGDHSFELYTEEEAETVPFTGEGPMQHELEHFLSCVEGDEEPKVSVDDAIEAARISLAAIESAERGEPVSPAEVGR